MKAAMIIAGLFMAPVAWVAGASAILCAGTGKWPLYQFPYAQWVQAAPYWRMLWQRDLWMGIMLVISAAAPSLIVAAVGYGAVKLLLHRSRRPEVYGKTGWATPKQMVAAGWQLRKKL